MYQTPFKGILKVHCRHIEDTVMLAISLNGILKVYEVVDERYIKWYVKGMKRILNVG